MSRSILPGLDVFIVRNFSVGLAAIYGVEDTETTVYTETYAGNVLFLRRPLDTTRTTYGGMLRIGGNVPLGRLFSLWPRMGLGFSKTSVSVEHLTSTLDPNAAPDFDYDRAAVFADLNLPLLVHLARHLYAGVGLNLRTGLSAHPAHHVSYGLSAQDGSSRTNLLGALTLGGWL
jgi:hypothetical protein